MLDKALAAASNPSAQTPSSILQQLKQARELYESDTAASFELVERLLTDMDDAEVGFTGAWKLCRLLWGVHMRLFLCACTVYLCACKHGI